MFDVFRYLESTNEDEYEVILILCRLLLIHLFGKVMFRWPLSRKEKFTPSCCGHIATLTSQIGKFRPNLIKLIWQKSEKARPFKFPLDKYPSNNIYCAESQLPQKIKHFQIIQNYGQFRLELSCRILHFYQNLDQEFLMELDMHIGVFLTGFLYFTVSV